MTTLIQGGHVIDPAGGIDRVADLWIESQRILDSHGRTAEQADRIVDASGCVVMAGGIDIHTHIGGGKLAIARLLMQDKIDETARDTARSAAECDYLPAPAIAAQRYLEMGYTVAFEPAVIPCNARAAHFEMADMPGLSTGGFCLLGNDEVLLKLIASGAEQPRINQYVAWMVRATQSIAVKVVNAGGISAFKYGTRNLDVDTPHPEYGITPGQVIRTLARAVHEIGLVHPLHVHCSNLGVPGNIDSTLATIQAADGYPVHLTHVQFHCYGNESKLGMESAAQRLVDALSKHSNVTIDVGQVMFGQTVTISADAPHQFDNRSHGSPRKSAIVDVECEAGCGVVPFRYRRRRYVHALQWAIGLELFLMMEDPNRVFLTTDHPNGAPFTTYPHLLRLLSDRSFRETALAEIHPDAVAATSLAGIEREYTLTEIATMTRAAPANIMGLRDHGRLTPGAFGDVTIYRRQSDIEAMFRQPEWVFVRGECVIDGRSKAGRLDVAATESLGHRTLTADVDAADDPPADIRSLYSPHATFDLSRLRIGDDEMETVIATQPTRQLSRSRIA